MRVDSRGISDIQEAIGKSVDVIRLDDTEGDPTFLAMALEDARMLVDRDEVWPRLRREESAFRRRGRRRDARLKREALAGIDRFLAARK